MMVRRGRSIRFEAMFRAFLALLLVTTVAPLSAPPPAEATTRLPIEARTLAVDASHTLEIHSDGTLWAWGGGAAALGLGYGVNESLAPTQVGTDRDWVFVDANGGRSFAIKSDGTLWCWGDNNNYALGLGDTVARHEPTLVNADTDWVAVATGGSNGSTFALKSDGSLWAWGYNGYGELGLGSPPPHELPTITRVGEDNDWVALSVANSHAAALKADGTLWTWGQNHDGQLGLGFTSQSVNVPTQVAGGDWVAVTTGHRHMAAIKADGSLWAWGDNSNSRLGVGEGAPAPVTSPMRVGDANDWVAAAEEDGDWFKYAGRTTTGNGWVIWHDHRPDDGDDDNADLYAKYIGTELPAAVPVAGADRISTAVAASKLAFAPGSVHTVVIATGFNWPDALGGTSLAGALNGPVLLVEQNALPSSVAAEITRLGASRAIILGGPNAVSANVAAALERHSGITKVERIAGSDRYQTADRIALRVISELGGRYSGMAFVSTGENFPDALAAAPLAASKNWPLFLAHPTRGLSSGTRSAMAKVDEAVILGGTAVVPQTTQNAINAMPGKKTTRLWGPDRYATAVAVANYAVTKQGHSWDRVGITTGFNFPDALSGGVVQGEWVGGKKPSVMLLTEPGSLNPRTAGALSSNKAAIDTITYYGGVNAVSNAVRTQANNLIK